MFHTFKSVLQHPSLCNCLCSGGILFPFTRFLSGNFRHKKKHKKQFEFIRAEGFAWFLKLRMLHEFTNVPQIHTICQSPTKDHTQVVEYLVNIGKCLFNFFFFVLLLMKRLADKIHSNTL